jgi:anti-sigma regulatory factor (Ser/Thr protein kinase)
MQTQPVIDLELARRPEAVRNARDALAPMSGRVPETVLDELRLVVSELVSNSIRHSTGDPGALIRLRVWLSAEEIRVEAADSGRGFDPTIRSAEGGSGWGLLLVGRLATRWGVAASDSGTTVWFERSLEGSPAH